MPVSGDEVRLRQVFSNLLLNAMKYTPSGGRIEVRGTRSGDHVEVTVSDTGIGMAKELVPRVFDLFVQGDTSRGGMGVGLNVVKRLVDAHGGQVDVQSEGPGRGSRFRVVLPATA
jgi:signal transduction histidine kinase